MFIETGRGRLYYEERGAGFPILFIHGLGGSSAIWFAQAEALAPQFRTIIYDWSGSGNSTAKAGEYSAEDWADEAQALCAALRIQRAAVAGHSLGAAVAMTLAARHPQLVSRLCLAGPVLKLGPAGVQGITARAAAVRRDGMPAVVDTIPQGALSPATRASNPAVHALFRASLLAHNPESYAAHCDALLRLDAAALIPVIHVPVLLIAGDCDPTAPLAAVQELAGRFRDGRAAVISGAAHAMQLDQPPAVTAAIHDFLKGER